MIAIKLRGAAPKRAVRCGRSSPGPTQSSWQRRRSAAYVQVDLQRPAPSVVDLWLYANAAHCDARPPIGAFALTSGILDGFSWQRRVHMARRCCLDDARPPATDRPWPLSPEEV